MGGLLHLVQRVGAWRARWAAAPPSSLFAVPKVTAHPSTASVPITVLLYDGPLLCGFNVAIKGLISMYASTSVGRFLGQFPRKFLFPSRRFPLTVKAKILKLALTRTPDPNRSTSINFVHVSGR